jgi:OOP family OmpA-OmpF porin
MLNGVQINASFIEENVMKKLVFVGLATALMSSGLLAADQGAFVEAAVGQTKFKVDGSSGWNMNDKDTSWSVLGGYMVNNNLGFEAGYLDLGKVSGSITGNLSGNLYGRALVVNGTVTANGDAKGWVLGVRGDLPINEKFSLNGRVGLYQWESDVKATLSAAGTWGGTAVAANGSASQSYKGSDTYYGLGAKYAVSKQVAIGFGYSNYKLGKVEAKADNWDLNVNYRF